MKNYYYMRFNIADAPEEIDCGSIVRMAKEVNEILGCEYERFGYHYDNPDNTNGSPCGKTFRKGKEETFKKLELKKYYCGKKYKDEIGRTYITFYTDGKNKYAFPEYQIEIKYEEDVFERVCIEIYVTKRYLGKKITMQMFRQIQKAFEMEGYGANSAFLHCCWGDNGIWRITGTICSPGIVTLEDSRVIQHFLAYREGRRDKMMDLFFMNAISKTALSDKVCDQIKKLVGETNYVEEDGKVFFQLPQPEKTYWLNRIFPVWPKGKIKHLLQNENVMDKDTGILTWWCLLLP